MLFQLFSTTKYQYVKAQTSFPPSGVIYLCPEAQVKEQQIKISPVILKQILSTIGYVCVGAGLTGLLVLTSPVLLAEVNSRIKMVQNMIKPPRIPDLRFVLDGLINIPKPEKLPLVTLQPTPTPTPDPASLPFSISIPKINLEAKVVSNVDTNNEEVYRLALKEGVAHALGTAFPGQGKMVFIFAHSSDYVWNLTTHNPLFYQVKDLKNDDIIVLKLGEQEYQYKVFDRLIVKPDDIEVVNQNLNNNMLILQTCYPPGTNWQRLLVLAEPIGS